MDVPRTSASQGTNLPNQATAAKTTHNVQKQERQAVKKLLESFSVPSFTREKP